MVEGQEKAFKAEGKALGLDVGNSPLPLRKSSLLRLCYGVFWGERVEKDDGEKEKEVRKAIGSLTVKGLAVHIRV